jgi:hypothetical protein
VLGEVALRGPLVGLQVEQRYHVGSMQSEVSGDLINAILSVHQEPPDRTPGVGRQLRGLAGAGRGLGREQLGWEGHTFSIPIMDPVYR